MSLFPQAPPDLTPPKTPAIATGDHEDFFFSKEPALANPMVVESKEPLSMALSDPHSPIWGSGVYNQPKARASSPPPASILRHEKSQGGIMEPSRLLGRFEKDTNQPREHSYDRAFRTAEWTVQPAEQGNGGLRNAVRAASEAGTLKDILWVRNPAQLKLPGS